MACHKINETHHRDMENSKTIGALFKTVGTARLNVQTRCHDQLVVRHELTTRAKVVFEQIQQASLCPWHDRCKSPTHAVCPPSFPWRPPWQQGTIYCIYCSIYEYSSDLLRLDANRAGLHCPRTHSLEPIWCAPQSTCAPFVAYQARGVSVALLVWPPLSRYCCARTHRVC